MLDNINIFLIIVFGVIFLLIVFRQNRGSKGNENFVNKNKVRTNDLDIDNVTDDVISWDDSIDGMVDSPVGNPEDSLSQSTVYSNIVKKELKSNLIENQFHNDYRDVITGLNNIVPEKKQKFNIANIPLNYSEPNHNEVKKLLNDFINVLNTNIKNEVPSQRNKNSGWDEAVEDPNIESGWDKVQKSLNLAPSLFKKPATKSTVKLIRIFKVQKYETEDEIKYTVEFVVQKNNVEDQMILKCSFVQDKRPMVDENNFFLTKQIEMLVIIEDVFIVGYLSNDGNDSRLHFDGDHEKYFNYDGLEQNNLTDPKYIQKIMMDKYKNQAADIEFRNSLLDEEGQDFHRTLPNIYDFSNIKNTRTIFDDMNTKKKFY